MFTQQKFQRFLARFDESKRVRMAEIYAISYRKHEAECLDSLEHKDMGRLKGAAHDLKSISYTIEAEDLGRLAEAVEADILSGEEGAAYEKAQALPPMIREVLKIIES